ncbi:hypothetical protein KM918_07665 [Priestia megaterium]|uniref:hypothetical protein n=1 Tax=Priestia megaterium TaxID=1404 RepID=UPI001C21F31F|nr:hypothetical protein [Priestia megaterium]MBU8687224.1 hypothetical protein [Priestia megaterium]
MIGGRGEDSCGNSGTGKTPQERKRRGGSPAARGKGSIARKSTAVSQAVQLMYPICTYLNRINLVCANLIFALYAYILKKDFFPLYKHNQKNLGN